jgi:putative CocE/NonD family hydrolase
MTKGTAMYDVRVLHDQRVPLSDGVKVSADVYLPLGNGPWPVIYQWTPYESTRERFVEWGVWFAQRGYAAVVQDVRGRYESGGEFLAWERDGVEAVDSIDWAASAPWSNGKIGTWGRSYGAIVQWQLARHQHPAVRCLAPHVICDDYYGDCHYAGGVFQLALSVGAALIWNSSLSLVTLPSARHTVLTDRVLKHLPLIDLDEVAVGRELATWRAWMEHPTYDAYWAQFDHGAIFERVNVPMFQQCGWFDAYPGSTMRAFNGVQAPQKVLMGPWSHEEEISRHLGGVDFGPEADGFIREHELRWYDHWLRDIDTGMMDEPAVSLFTMGVNRWRHDDEWPPPGTTFTPFYLHSGGRANTSSGDGTLSVDAPSPGEPADTYASDPEDPVPTVGGNNSVATMMANSSVPVAPGPADQAPIERRDDVLVYSSDALDAELEVTGPIEMTLYAASSARDCDFFVRLADVSPDGRSTFIAEGMIRARHRDGFDAAELLEPGEVAEYRIRCYPTSNVFRRGHRLRLTVSSSSFPRFARNLQTGESIATGTRIALARQTVLHTDAYPSHILLPVQAA